LAVVKVPNDVPLELLGPLACGLGTGAGAVLNEARPRLGDSILVAGVGAVGLAAIMAAGNSVATIRSTADTWRSSLGQWAERGVRST
jgi:aryl-alcohol dehydrogenase